MGWGERWERGSREWLIHVDVWQKPAQAYKAIILQLKIKFLEKEMAAHSSILAWKNPMDRGAW